MWKLDVLNDLLTEFLIQLVVLEHEDLALALDEFQERHGTVSVCQVCELNMVAEVRGSKPRSATLFKLITDTIV